MKELTPVEQFCRECAESKKVKQETLDKVVEVVEKLEVYKFEYPCESGGVAGADFYKESDLIKAIREIK